MFDVFCPECGTNVSRIPPCNHPEHRGGPIEYCCPCVHTEEDGQP